MLDKIKVAIMMLRIEDISLARAWNAESDGNQKPLFIAKWRRRVSRRHQIILPSFITQGDINLMEGAFIDQFITLHYTPYGGGGRNRIMPFLAVLANGR